jgi:hypothetical protein
MAMRTRRLLKICPVKRQNPITSMQ